MQQTLPFINVIQHAERSGQQMLWRASVQSLWRELADSKPSAEGANGCFQPENLRYQGQRGESMMGKTPFTNEPGLTQ